MTSRLAAVVPKELADLFKSNNSLLDVLDVGGEAGVTPARLVRCVRSMAKFRA
jgi:hypothetical protein